MRTMLNLGLAALLLALVPSVLPPAAQADSLADEAIPLINKRCAACHEQRGEGQWKHISDQRKTPEGWDMNIIRMTLWHGVQVPAKERRVMVKYLADTQGLAPAETAPYRYILERRPNVIESPDDETIAVMCARCHSYARTALQRRDAASWLKLSHAHVGQIPTIEYHALARDRDWWEIARTDVPKILGEKYPLNTAAWRNWKDRASPDLAGTWRVAGHRAGQGDFTGTATVKHTGTGPDEYAVTYELRNADGSLFAGAGTSILYTGYEWRGTSKLGSDPTLEVFAVSPDGKSISGRWFLELADEIGGEMRMVRADGPATVMQVQPAYLRAGASATVSVHGTGLRGSVNLGAGVQVQEVVSQNAGTVTVRVKVADGAAVGPRSVAVGNASGEGLFTVYRRVDSVKVEPEFAISRVGGGSTPAVAAQFEAVGYANGPDGEAGTDDDIRIGVMPAEWRTENLTDVAKEMQDAKYVGTIQSDGLFVPSFAGLNPERKFSTNNAGELAVIATVTDQGRTVSGQGSLVATVQRWNNPPIR